MRRKKKKRSTKKRRKSKRTRARRPKTRRRRKRTKRRVPRARFSTDRSDESAWRAAFTRRHGRAPTSGDWLMDYNYTWQDRYAAAAPRASSRSDRLLVKLRALANDPGATPAERENARMRISELSRAA